MARTLTSSRPSFRLDRPTAAIVILPGAATAYPRRSATNPELGVLSHPIGAASGTEDLPRPSSFSRVRAHVGRRASHDWVGEHEERQGCRGAKFCPSAVLNGAHRP